MLLATTSCQQDEFESSAQGNEVDVTFTLQQEGATGAATRAIGDGTTAKYLYFGAYDVDGKYLQDLQPTNVAAGDHAEFDENLTTTVKLRLVKGQTYSFLFWAQSTEDETYYNVDFGGKQVNVKYGKNDAGLNVIAANDEKRDAFWTTKTYTINGPITETITLKRPFAQVNVGIEKGELAEAAKAGVNVVSSSFYFNEVATTLNVFSGKVGNHVPALYEAAGIPAKWTAPEDLKNVNSKDYEYIAMNYILVNDLTTDDSSAKYVMGDAAFTIWSDTKAIKEYKVPNLPVQRNYRTNIIGSIMSDAEFTIVINPIFDGDINYPDDQKNELLFAAANGGEVTLNEDVALDSTLIVNGDLVINLNGNDITNTSESSDIEKGDGIIVYGSLVINGEGTVKAKTRTVWARGNGSTVKLNGGNYIGANANTEVIYASGDGKIEIYGGTYEALQQSTAFAEKQYAILNLHSNGKNGCDIKVYGGTFKNFDPANNYSENPKDGYHDSNFVVDGYASIKTEADGVALYTVKQMTGNVTATEDMVVTKLVIPAGEESTLNLGEFTLTGTVTVEKGGKLTVENGKIVNTDSSVSGITSNGDLVLNDVEISSARHALRIESGTAVINGGTYKVDPKDAKTLYALNVGDENTVANVTVKGGTFIGPKGTNADSGAAVTVKAGSTVTIEGGDFSGGKNNTLTSKGTLTISGGTFDQTPAAWVAEGYTAIQNGEKYYVVAEGVDAVATTDEELTQALNEGKDVALGKDVESETLFTLKNGATLDGNGYSLSVPYESASGWGEYAVVMPQGGTVKNLTVTDAFRGIGASPSFTGDITIDNVTIDKVTYAINGDGNGTNTVSVTNSTINGWISCATVKLLSFKNCTLGKGNSSYAYLVVYGETAFENCTFVDDFAMCARMKDNNVIAAGKNVTFTNCTHNGEKVTAANFKTKFMEEGDDTDFNNLKACNIIIDGVKVTW
ncbi:MAG: hypothetical protein IJ494_06260, partial [Bacteroides sp.]|nr:hypothetical protein [Bacteroides sp.]